MSPPFFLVNCVFSGVPFYLPYYLFNYTSSYQLFLEIAKNYNMQLYHHLLLQNIPLLHNQYKNVTYICSFYYPMTYVVFLSYILLLL